MVRRRNLKSEERAARVLEVAKQKFLTAGYFVTSVDEIVSEAGGSKTSIYQLFGNKEGLLRALVEDTCRTVVAKVVQQPHDQENLRDYLTRVGKIYLENVVSEETVGVLRLCISSAIDHPEISEIYLNQGLGQAVPKLSKSLKTFQSFKTFTPAQSQQAAREFLAMCRGDLHLRALLSGHSSVTKAQVTKRSKIAVDAFSKVYLAT